MRTAFRRSILLGVTLAGALLLQPAFLVGESPKPAAKNAAPVDFLRDIRPIFQARCFSCHGPIKQKGDLRLDRKETALKGGESGPVIVAGKSGESLLLRRVRSKEKSEQMPPSGERLTQDQIDLLRSWIDRGAPWQETTLAESRKSHWSFQPVARPRVPENQNPIDYFIRARLDRDGLQPSPEADRPTLIRRLKFDLLGLPPAPEEVQAFVNDKSPTAYEKLVDRYLASPHFGERWPGTGSTWSTLPRAPASRPTRPGPTPGPTATTSSAP